MDLTINVREVQGVSILDLKGRVVLGDESDMFDNRVEELVAAGKKKILLNMEHISKVDSTGLGKLAKCLALTQDKGGDLKLLKVNKKVLELLVYTVLVTKFDKVYDEETEAVSSFKKA